MITTHWTGLVVSSCALFALGCSAKSNFTGIPDGGASSDGGPGSTADGGKPKRDGGKPTPATATPDEACESWVTASCAREKKCGAVRFQLAWGDESSCTSRKKLGCAERFAAPGVTQTPAELAACAAAMNDADCEDLALGKLPSECEVTGSLAKGDGCANDAQCASGFCRFNVGSGCGSCAERGKDFASCSVSAECAPGLLCSSRSCKKPEKQGGFCSRSSDCAPWLVCSQDGSCEKGAPAGSSCAGGGPSDVYGCDEWNGVVCNSLLMSCTAVTVRAVGAPCDGFNDVCAAGATCTGFGGGECVAPPREGEACSTLGTTGGCLWPAQCANGECVLPDPEKCK